MANLVPFHVDLTTQEGLRLAAVMDALGPGWDPWRSSPAKPRPIGCSTPIWTPINKPPMSS